MAEPAASAPSNNIQFDEQWQDLKRTDGYRGKVDMRLPSLGIAKANFNYPSGSYCVESSDHWGVGIVKRPFDIGYCASGEAKSGQRSVYAGEILVSGPVSGFDAKLRTGTNIEYLVISKQRFERNLPCDLRGLDTPPDAKEAFFSSNLLPHLVQSLLHRLACGLDENCFYVETIVDAIIAELLKDALIDTDTAPIRSDQFSEMAFEKLRSYIAANLSSKIEVEDLAACIGIPPGRFRKMLKAQTGKTPYQLILDTRVFHAQVMLTTTQLSPAKVAFDCGFASQSHMSDVFRQRLGKTPGQVRLRS